MHRAAFLCLLAGGCAIAFAPIFVRLSDTGPLASAFWRVALAAPFLWLMLLRTGDRPLFSRQAGFKGSEYLPHSRADQRAGGKYSDPLNPAFALSPVLLSGIFFALDLGVWHYSIAFTSVANSTLLANLAPIFVTLMGWALWRQTVTRTFLAGMVVAIAGMFVLVGPNFSIGGQRLLGDALGALTAVFYGSYMLAIKRARDGGASTARLMAWSSTISAVALLPFALLAPQPFLPASLSGWLVLLGLALVSQVMGQSLIAYAFAHLPASLSSVSLLVQPVVAALAAWILFAEPVVAMQFIGGAIVLGGIWIAKKGS